MSSLQLSPTSVIASNLSINIWSSSNLFYLIYFHPNWQKYPHMKKPNQNATLPSNTCRSPCGNVFLVQLKNYVMILGV